MPDNDDWDDVEGLEKDQPPMKDLFKLAGKKILGGGQDTTHLDRVNNLVKQQNALNDKIKLLQEEKRRIQEKIKTAEEPKNQTEANQNKTIATALREIEQVQKDIRSEISKLSSKTREIKSSTQQVTSTPEAPSMGMPPGAPPLPPGAPPLPPGPLVTKKVSPVVKKAPPESIPKSTERTTIDMSQLAGGAKNLKSGGKQVTDKTPEQIAQEQQEDIERYEKSIKNKTEEIDRLIGEVSGLSTTLKTAEASKGQYEQALEKQNELLADLNKKKEALDGKLKDVKGKVSVELEKIEAKRKAEEEEKQRKAEEEQARLQSLSSAELNVPNAPSMDGMKMGGPPPPPSMDGMKKGGPPPAPSMDGMKKGGPPPAPSMEGLSGAKPKGKDSAINRDAQQSATQSTSATDEKGGADMGEVLKKGQENVKRQEEKRVQDHLVGKLIDLVVMVGEEDIDDVDLDANQLRILDAIGGEAGFKSLREALIKGMEAVPKKADPFDAITKRRGAIAQGEVDSGGLSIGDVEKYKDKPEFKGALVSFIQSQPEKGKVLLTVAKEIKVAEDKETERLNELKRIEDARIAQENAIKAAEEKRIKEDKRALEVQAKLKGMGVTEGVVNPTGVQTAETNKDQVIEDVSAKRRALNNTDDLLSEIERELSNGIGQLEEAESSRDLALEEQAKKKVEVEVEPIQPTVPTETVPVIEEPQATVTQEEQQNPVIQPPTDQPPIVEVQPEVTPEGTPSVVTVNPPQPNAPNESKRKDQIIIEEKARSPYTPAELNRKNQLAEFDQALESFMRKSQGYRQNGNAKAYAEANKVCTNLVNARDDFIYQRKGKDGEVVTSSKFHDLCTEYTDPKNTPVLSESRGIKGALDRIINAVKHAFSGTSTYKMENKSSKEHMCNLKNSLKDLKEADHISDAVSAPSGPK